MTSYDFSPNESLERALFQGSGFMSYPEGELRYVLASVADCLITTDEIRLRPKNVLWDRVTLGWPGLVLAREDIRAVDRVLFGKYRFRSDSKLLDGACFRPIRCRQAFLTALEELGIAVNGVSSKEKMAFELRMLMKQNDSLWRLVRRLWTRGQHKPRRQSPV